MSLENRVVGESKEFRNFYLCLAGLSDEILKQHNMLSGGPFNRDTFLAALERTYEAISDPKEYQAAATDNKLGVLIFNRYVRNLSVRKYTGDLKRIDTLAQNLLRTVL